MKKQVFYLLTQHHRQQAARAVMQAEEGHRVEIRARTRSIAQNDLMWSCLTDLSKQVEWPINGKLEKLTPEDWKDIATASLGQENRIAAGIRGGFVFLGKSTSKMTVPQMTELVDFIHAFGTEHGVHWSPTSLGRDG